MSGGSAIVGADVPFYLHISQSCIITFLWLQVYYLCLRGVAVSSPLEPPPDVDVGSDGQHLSPLALSAKLRFHFFSASVNNLRIHLQLDMSFI